MSLALETTNEKQVFKLSVLIKPHNVLKIIYHTFLQNTEFTGQAKNYLHQNKLQRPTGIRVLNGFNELIGLKGLKALKRLKGLKGLKGLKVLKGLKGLKRLKGRKGVKQGSTRNLIYPGFLLCHATRQY